MEKSEIDPSEEAAERSMEQVSFRDGPLGNPDQDWPYETIMSLDSNDACPVVFDTSSKQAFKTSSLKAAQVSSEALQLSHTLRWAVPPHDLSHLLNASQDPLFLDNFNENGNADEKVEKESLVALLMKQREMNYTKLEGHTVFCGTWNVNDHSVESELKEWMAPPEDSKAPDFYAIGLQEMELGNHVYLLPDPGKERAWRDVILKSTHPAARYELLERSRLAGMLLFVLVKEGMRQHVSDLKQESTGNGVFGRVGNKGAVSIRFRYKETTMCFVSSHLAAHASELERRNRDFRDINSKIVFKFENKRYSISDHDVIFWMGDLNYRIVDVNIEMVKKLVVEKAFTQLHKHDQLIDQMKKKLVFQGYSEGVLNFEPTFKFKPGSNNWSTGENARVPSWCDRVLWKGDNIHQSVYRAHHSITLSDHKPVSAVFNVGIKVFDKERERSVREEVMKLLDQHENNFLPHVTLSSSEVSFSDMKYLDSQQQSVKISNVGQVPVDFKFLVKAQSSSLCPAWLSVQPFNGYISVGDSIDLVFEVQINSKTVDFWNSHKMGEILVLHLVGGKDLFITVVVNTLDSCFGMPLKNLNYITTPVALDITRNLSSTLGVPKELWFLVDYLYNHGIGKVGLFERPSIEKEIKEVRDELDTKVTGLTHKTFQVDSVAQSLLVFLDSLPEPVIPFKLYKDCIYLRDNLRHEILSKLPPEHSRVFVYLCAFLREILSHADTNYSDPLSMAKTFSPVLLKSGKREEADVKENSKKVEFLLEFLRMSPEHFARLISI